MLLILSLMIWQSDGYMNTNKWLWAIIFKTAWNKEKVKDSKVKAKDKVDLELAELECELERYSDKANTTRRQGVCQVREVKEKSGNYIFPQKFREKSGNLDKSQGKVRESFLEQQDLDKVSNFQ